MPLMINYGRLPATEQTGPCGGGGPSRSPKRTGLLMNYRELLDAVQPAAELDTSDQARNAVSAVLATCAHCLPPPVRHRLADRLPGFLESALSRYGTPRALDCTAVIAEVAWRLAVSPERARHLIDVVLRVLRLQDPELLADLTAHLRVDVVDQLTTAPEPLRPIVTPLPPAVPPGTLPESA
ncbi:DUF2267 domain-containing protein [Nocardia sp. NPDC056611]|uniref:DUF2267 domain-containing protein n=1 Tax=Nocardia sp. NPDC056611 TaxID=3345877 RepID=UPI00366E3961